MFEQAFKICMMKHEMDIDPFSLRCLVEVVSQRSITQAAQRLGMAQPSLSHVLARLRKHFGDPLLLRAGMTMTPTPRALRLAAAAEDVLDAMVRLHSQSTMGTEASAPPRFVMTCTDYYERLLAPALTRKMRELAPDTCMEWRTPDRAAAREWLERGEVDLRLAWVHSPWPGLRFRRLLEDRLVCLVRKGHPDVGMRLTETDFFRLPHVRPVVRPAPTGAPCGRSASRCRCSCRAFWRYRKSWRTPIASPPCRRWRYGVCPCRRICGCCNHRWSFRPCTERSTGTSAPMPIRGNAGSGGW